MKTKQRESDLTNKRTIQIGLKQLYFISFIEGGLLMVTELAGARLLTPFFGASLYSWASTLSITLAALMSGYYTGGYMTTKRFFASVEKIIWVFFICGLSVLLMPSLANFIMRKTILFSFFSGLIISQLFFMFIPVFLMGTISPMIIFQITKKAEQSGRSAGNIYAISTCGGILFTLVFGFLIIPNYGITLPVRVLGLLVSLIGLFFLIKEKMTNKTIPLAGALILVSAVVFTQNKYKESPKGSGMKMVAYSEGLLGEIKVVDEPSQAPDGSTVEIRKLRTNNVEQNYVFADDPTQSLLYYVNFTRQLLRFVPKKQSALIIGLGAGSLYSILRSENINAESVEIDKRIYDFGVKYFAMPAHDNNTITDGRYFINVTNKKYDLIILDVIIGENVPAQLITLESFQRLYQLLNENGTLLVEYGGVNDFVHNSFAPCIDTTLRAAGFQVNIFNPLKSTEFGDVLFLATKSKFDISNIKIDDDVLIRGGALSSYKLPVSVFDNSAVNVLTDDKNNSDILLKLHYLQVRQGIRTELARSEQ
jgi:spermidine synthase